jgi:hypothetical protein
LAFPPHATDTGMTATPLTDDHVRFITGRISITAASRDARRVPSVVRAAACRVSADRRRVTLLLATQQSQQVLADIAATGAIAVVFSEPSTHRTLQFKGRDAARCAVLPDDLALACAHNEAFADEIVPLGYPRALALTVHSVPGDELTAVSFTVDAIFEQTPGPKAGARVTP